MTEYEILDLVAAESSQMASQFNIYLTVLFAYLLAAYFIGDKLSRPQLFVLTALYIYAWGAEIFGMKLTLNHVAELFEKKAQLMTPTSYKLTYASYTYVWLAAMIIAMIAGHYFMWSVRRTKPD